MKNQKTTSLVFIICSILSSIGFAYQMESQISLDYEIEYDESYATFPATFKLSILNGTNGFAINGIDKMDLFTISEVGDVNGDGINDILMGVPSMNNGIGQSYVVFGGRHKWSAEVNLIDLNGTNGFVIDGIKAFDGSGRSVSGAGDVNGDGIDDILIGAPFANGTIGQSYVIFGRKGAWPATISLYDLDGANGFAIDGLAVNSYFGSSVSRAGDINGDGIDDILLGAPATFSSDQSQSYVVFGSKQVWPAIFNLMDLDGINGFAMEGINANDSTGLLVSRAGDVNGDGIDDILIGTSNNHYAVGQSYALFGKKSGWWPAVFNLTSLNGTNGFAINGTSGEICENFIYSISGAGDVNGDSIDDILIGNPCINSRTGQSYVIFGSKNRRPPVISLLDLNGNNGFAIKSVRTGDFNGASVSGAGDVNGDGIDDILIGATYANNNMGQSYVVYGSKNRRPGVFNLVNLNGTNGFTMNGVKGSDTGFSVSGAGDVNGDGIDDILISAPGANNGLGQGYVVFGQLR